MSYLRTDKGFTLFELVIVLAISGLAMVGVLAATAGVQQRTAFSSAIDAFRLQLKGVQNEAIQSVASRSGANVGTSDEINFGKLIELDNSSPATASQMKTWTLVESADKSSLFKCDEQDVTLDQQVNFLNATNGANTDATEAIVFGRDPNQTYVIPNFLDTPKSPPIPTACSPSASPAPVVPNAPVNNCVITQANPIGVCASPQPPPPPVNCNADPAWQCGLYGQYYKGTAIAGSPNSAFIDAQVGTNLGNGASSYPVFAPTLTGRAQVPSLGVAVDWSGQIRLGNEPGDIPTPQAHTYCFTGDQGSAATITVSGTVYTLTGNLGSRTPPASSCVSIQVATAGWYDIHIQYSRSGGGRSRARLYEQSVAGPLEIANADLRTSSSNHPIPPASAFVNGLYGEYYSDATMVNRVSAYTDPLIGDGGFQFSFNNGNPSDDVFSPTLEWNTAKATTYNDSVKWTGQVLVDTAGPQTYCIAGIDGTATLKIDGTKILSGNLGFSPTCAATGPLTAGWHNVEYDYATSGGGGSQRAVRFGEQVGVDYKDVPNDHLRRPLDWSATGSQGTCSSGDTDCMTSGTDIQENSSSNGDCNSSDQRGVMNFTKSGLTPDSTYKLDLSYFNAPGAQDLPVPDSYSYEVCVSVNGTLVGGGSPAYLPISEPSINPRTYTFSDITVPSNGDITISLDWLNDSSSGGFSSGYNDANFAISRLDLYRSVTAAGQLSAAAPKPATPTAIAPATLSPSTLAARLLNLLAPSAQAASGCTTTILDPNNYTTNCFGAGPLSTLNLQVIGESGKGFIDISTQDGSIERRITN